MKIRVESFGPATSMSISTAGTIVWPSGTCRVIAEYEDRDEYGEAKRVARDVGDGWKVVRWEHPVDGEPCALVRVPCVDFEQRGAVRYPRELSASELEAEAIALLEQTARTNELAAELLRRAQEKRAQEAKGEPSK